MTVDLGKKTLDVVTGVLLASEGAASLLRGNDDDDDNR